MSLPKISQPIKIGLFAIVGIPILFLIYYSFLFFPQNHIKFFFSDLSFIFFSNPYNNEIHRLTTCKFETIANSKKTDPYGVREIKPDKTNNNRQFNVAGKLIAKGVDWIEVDTGERKFRLMTDPRSSCFSQLRSLPEQGSSGQVEGELIDCKSENFKLGYHAYTAVQIDSGTGKVRYGQLLLTPLY